MKKRTYPGSIFIDKGKLYIKFKGKKYSTGLEPTKTGYQRAEMKLEQLWMAYNRLEDVVGIQRLRIKEAFERFLETKINRYAKTIVTYNLAYRAIIKDNYYLDKDNIEKDIQRYISTTSHNPVSRNTYLTHLQVFLNFCTKKNWLQPTNFKSEYKSKIIDNEPQSWTDKEVAMIINYFNNNDREISLLIEFMTETGARVVDCLTLEPSQIKSNVIIWRNKITKKPEPRPISKRARDILNMLPARNEQIWKWSYTGKSFLNRKLREACFDLNIDRKGRSFQEFRVTFRMKLLNKGVPPDYIMYLMRHKDRKVTDDFYTFYDNDYIKKYLDPNTDKLSGKVE